MWFMVKAAFWFSLVLLMLPLFDSGPAETTGENMSAAEIGQTISAASQAITYVSAICSEKPDVCVQGAKTVEALGQRARHGAKVAYSLLDEHFGKTTPAKPVDAVTTGSLPASHIPVPVPRPDPDSQG